MIRINLQYVFALSTRLREAEKVPRNGGRVADMLPALGAVQQMLMEVYGDNSLYEPHLRHSSPLANRLFQAIKGYLDAYSEDEGFELDRKACASFHSLANEFRIVFESDLAGVSAYVVSRKAAFDLLDILERGELLFPAAMVAKVPETLSDAREAGRALAFELPTACGFHVFRAAESVLKKYWDHVSAGTDRPSLETIGNYAAEMEKGRFGDKKVIESLRHLARHHRNPIIHPDYILTLDEAVDTLGGARSAIGAMLAPMPVPPPTTSTPPSVLEAALALDADSRGV